MKQRLIKAIYCIALSVSVFFCLSFPAHASEVGPADEIGFEVDGSSSRTIGLIGVITDNNYCHAVGYIDNNFTLILNPGYVYNGQITCRFTLTYSAQHISNYFTQIVDVNVRSSLADVGVAYNYVKKSNDVITFDLIMSFNGLYVESTLPITVSITPQVNVFGVYAGSSVNLGTITLSAAGDFASRNWTATLPYDYNEGGIITEQGVLDREQQAQISQQEMAQQQQISQQEMAQQQQIADQQAQQSAQQHDDLVNGYDNAANDNMLADKNSVLQGFEQQQDQAISGGQQYVADYSSGFSTAPLQAMAPAFMMISTWFNDLWSGMGNFSTVLVVGLMLCVAGYILKLKH